MSADFIINTTTYTLDLVTMRIDLKEIFGLLDTAETPFNSAYALHDPRYDILQQLKIRHKQLPGLFAFSVIRSWYFCNGLSQLEHQVLLQDNP